MKKIVLLLGAFLVVATAAVNAEKVIIGTSAYPPFHDEKLPGSGWTPQFVTESLKGMGYEIEYQFIPLGRLQALVSKGEIGAMWPLRIDNIVAKNLFNFSVVFFYKKSAFPQGITFKTLADMAKYKVGGTQTELVEIIKKAGLTLQINDSVEILVKKLKTGALDSFMAVDVAGTTVLKSMGENPDDYGMSAPALTFPESVLFSKNYPNVDKVMKDLDIGYQRALKSGALTKILEDGFYGKGKVPDWALKF